MCWRGSEEGVLKDDGLLHVHLHLDTTAGLD